MQHKFFIFLFIFFIQLTTAHAKSENFFSLAPIIIQNNNIILPGVDISHASKIYFLKNTSSQSIWLEHPIARPSASAGWSSYLRAGNWAVLFLNKKNFVLSCALIQPGKVNYLNCVKVLAVYIPQRVVLNKNSVGSYWLAEDQPWDGLLKALKKRGVEIKAGH